MMSHLDTKITVVRPISDLAEEEWHFALFNARLQCVRYVYHVRATKRHKWTARRLWDWYSRRDSFDRDSTGHPADFKAENIPWSDELAIEAKRMLLASLDKQIQTPVQPMGQLQ